MQNKRKFTTAIVASVVAVALLLGGTFAWQSINQTALNEASDVINPGGRLHDDFDGSNKDVYVENFADEDIFARIQLSEYFEIVLNYNTAGVKTENIIGSKTQKTDENGNGVTDAEGNPVYEYTYVPYLFDDNDNGDGTFNAGIDADGNPYWTWSTGGDTIFMPTFNKNKDSLAADINGNYVDAIGGISNRDDKQYENYVEYTDGAIKDGNAIYDIDANMADELAQNGVDISGLIDGTVTADGYTDYVSLVEETHTAKATGNGELISMADWLAMVEADGGYNEADHGYYWVYDTDGWVYWSAPIASGEATGLLLDGIELSDVMDDTWYYAINVVAQFVTAGDTGSLEDGTGFYDTDKGSAPSEDALNLLDKIGINDTTPGVDEDETDPEPDEMQTLYLTEAGTNSVTIASGDSVKLEAEDGADLSSIKVTDVDGDVHNDWTYDAETGVLKIYDGGYAPYTITDATGTYSGEIDFEGSSYTIDIYTSIRDFESPDTGAASFVKPGQEYQLWVELTPEDLEAAPEGFDWTSAVPALSFTGTDIAGNEVAIDGTYTLGEWTAFTYGVDEDYDEEYYRATTTITFDKSVGYGTTITMESTLVDYENDFDSWDDYVVSDHAVDWNDVTIDLYDPNGDKLTVNTVQPNTTYDIVISMLYEGETIVIYSSNATYGTVSDRVGAEVAVDLYTHYNDANGDVYNFDIDSETGKLVVGEDVDPNVGWEETGDFEYIDELNISFCIGDLLIDEGLATETHCYVYDERDMYFHGEEPFNVTVAADDYEIYDYEVPLYMILNNEPKQIIVLDGLDFQIRNDITSEVIFTITGNEDENTKIEKAEDGYYYLTVGENETAEDLTVTAKAADGRGEGSVTIRIVYGTVMVNGEELTTNENGEYVYNATGGGEYTFALNGSTEATWEMAEGADEGMTFDSETGVLTVTKPENSEALNATCTIWATITYSEEDYIVIVTNVEIIFSTTAE